MRVRAVADRGPQRIEPLHLELQIVRGHRRDPTYQTHLALARLRDYDEFSRAVSFKTKMTGWGGEPKQFITADPQTASARIRRPNGAPTR